CINTNGVGFIPKGMFTKNFTNFDSIVDLGIMVCLVDLHAATPPPSVNTYPLVDFVTPFYPEYLN
ncbi:hypothetical protein CR513_22622, partial [Mucuna pruriens]